MKKRMLSILLALVMCVSMLPMQVFAAQDDSVTVTLDPETVVFSPAETSAQAMSLLTLDDAGKVALKATNEVDWIDRLDLTGAIDTTAFEEFDNNYALGFYHYLESSTHEGGDLRSAWASEYSAVTFTGKGEFAYTGDKAVDSEAAYAAIADELAANRNEASAYLSAVYYAFDRDHPEVFWLSGESMLRWYEGYSYSSDGTVTYEQTISFVLRDEEKGFDIRDGRYLDESLNLDEEWINDIDAESQAIATELSMVVRNIAQVDSREPALRELHDYLTTSNEYNTSDDLSSADSICWEYVTAIVGSEGTKGPVCEAYARAFKVVCDKAGIPCVLVDGFASPDGVDGEAHMWNYVQMEDGLWYAVDVTWDDPVVAGVSGAKSGYEHEDYFLVGAQTEIDGVTFEVSHPVSNAPSSSAPNFTNGPVLSDDDYVASEGGNTGDTGDSEEPRLMFYHVGMNDEIGAWVDMGWGMQDAWYSDGIYQCAQVVFCFGTEDDYIELDMDDLWVSDEKAVELIYEGTNTAGSDVMTLNVYEFGNHTVYYEDDTGVVHKMPVYVYLPDVGYFSQPAISEETYLHQFVLTETNRTYYLVSGLGDIVSVELSEDDADLAEYLQIEWEGNYASITFTENPPYTWMYPYLYVTIDRGEDYPDGWWAGMGLEVLVNESGEGGGAVEPEEPENPRDGGMCGDDLYWLLENGVLTISGSGAMYGYSGGGTPWANYKMNIAKVIVEDGVTSIGDYAFYECSALTEVVIPESVGFIGECAFAFCYALKGIDLPSALTSIEYCTFNFCEALSEITIPTGVTLVDAFAFNQCTALQEITFLGNAPMFCEPSMEGNPIFSGVTATVYYPSGNTTWTEAVMQNYGGTLTWVAVGGEEPTLTQIPAPTDLAWGRYYYWGNDGFTYAEYPGMISWRSGTFDYRHDIEIKVYRVSDDGTEDIEVWRSTWYCGRSDLEYNNDHDFSLAMLEELESGTYYFTAQAIGDGETTMDSELVTSDTWIYTRPTERLSAPTGLVWDGFVATWDRVSHENVGGYAVDFYYSPDESGENPECVTGFVRYSCEGEMLFFDPTFMAMADMGTGYYWFSVQTVSADMNTILHSECSDLSEPVYFEFDFDLDENGVLTVRGNGAVAGYWAYDPAITKVVIEEGITSIFTETFCCCENLTEVVIPGSVTEIDAYAFAWCEALENITFTGDAPYIGDYAFANVTATMYYPADNTTWTEAVMQNYGGTLTWVPVGEVMPEIIASGECGDNLTWELTDDGVLTIGGTGAMYDYDARQDTTLPGWHEYAGSITTVCLSKEQTTIGENAFIDLTALTAITVPDSVESIGYQAFWGCESLENISFGSGLKSIGEYVFLYCYALEKLEFGSALESIGMFAFSECTGLKEIFIPDNVTALGMGAFSNCTALTKVQLGSGVKTLDHYMFQDCSLLSEVVGLEHVTTINNYVFAGTALTEITIPASVQTIGNWTFQNCASLTKVTFEGDAPSIGDYAFQNVTATVYYPADNTTWTETVMENYGGTLTWKAMGGETETGCLLIFNFPADLCDVYATVANTTEPVYRSGDRVEAGTYLAYTITDIADGYRIKSVVMNGVDRTQGFVNGAYGGMATTIKDNVTVDVELEPIPEVLPSVDSVTLYMDPAFAELAADNVTVDGNTRFYGKATYSDGVDYPIYYIGGVWEYSTDGINWKQDLAWGSNRFDYWPGWTSRENFDPAAGDFFVTGSYDLRLRVEPKDLYSTGAEVLSNVIHVNGGAAGGEEPEVPNELAVTDLHFEYLSANSMPFLYWTAPANVEGDLRYNVYASTDGGQSWTVVSSTSQELISLNGLGAAVYTMFKVETELDNKVVAECSAKLTLTVTQGEDLPAATVVFTVPEAEGGDYAILVSGLTPYAWIRFNLKGAGGSSSSGSTSNASGEYTDSESWDNMSEYLADETSAYLVQEFSNPSIAEDGLSASFTVQNRGDWASIADAVVGGGTEEPVGQLMFHFVEWSENGWVERPEHGLGSSLAGEIGLTYMLKFYLVVGEELIPVDLEDLSATDGVNLLDLEGFVGVECCAFGRYEIVYTDADGVEYALPVAVELPMMGFYKDKTASEENYLYDKFTVTAENKTFYLIPREGFLTEVVLSNKLAAIATVAMAEDGRYAVITVTGTPDGGGYDVWAAYQTGSWSGSYSVGLTIYDGNPHLMFRYMNWDPEIGGYYEDTDEDLSTYWNASIDSSSVVKFYFGTRDSYVAVGLEDLTATDGVELSLTEERFVRIKGVDFGEQKVVYTAPDGEEYTLPVTVTLPTIGFYSTPEASEETYLYKNFVVTEESNTFYVVPGNGVLPGAALKDVVLTGDLADIATVTMAEDGSYAAITVTGTPGGYMYSVKASYNNGLWDSDYSLSLRISDGTSRLMFCYEGSNELYSRWDIEPGMSSHLIFYFGTEDNYAEVDFDSLSVSDSSALTLSEENGVVRVVAGYVCGEYSIIYTDENGKTYELPVVVALPDVGVYSTSVADPYTRTIRFVVTDESDTFYVVSVGGGMDGVTLSAGLAEIAEITEHGYNEDGEYIAIKVTGAPVSGVWYEIELVYYGYDGLSKGTRIMSVMLEDTRTVEPEIDYAVTDLRFEEKNGMPYLYWTAPAGLDQDVRYVVMLSMSVGGVNQWLHLNSTDETSMDLTGTPSGSYTAVKVVTKSGNTALGETLAESVADLALTATEGENLAPAAVVITPPKAEDGDYTISISGVTPNTFFLYGMRNTDGIRYEGLVSDADGACVYYVSCEQMQAYLMETDSAYQVKEFSGSVSEDGASAEFTRSIRGGWFSIADAVVDGGSEGALMFREADWTPETGWFDNPDMVMSTEWNCQIKSAIIGKFFFVTDTESVELTIDQLTVSGNGVMLNESFGLIGMSSNNDGSYKVMYTHTDGVTYNFYVNVALPNVAFYTQPVADGDYFVNVFTVTEMGQMLCLVPTNGYKLLEVAPSSELVAIAQFEFNVGENYAIMSITGVPGDCWYDVEVTYGNDDELYTETVSVRLLNGMAPPVVTTFELIDQWTVFGGTGSRSVASFLISSEGINGVEYMMLTYTGPDGISGSEQINIPECSYGLSVEGLPSGEYTVSVVAYDMYGSASEPASIVITVDNDPPAVTENVTAEGDFEKIVLNWTADTTGDVSLYRIERDGVEISVVSAGVSSYADYTAQPGVEHSYCVVAEDELGNRAASAAVKAQRTADEQAPVILDIWPTTEDNVTFCYNGTVSLKLSDNWKLAKLEAFCGDELVYAAKMDYADGYVEFTWDVSRLNGEQTLDIKVTDAAGNVTERSVTVTVRPYSAPMIPGNLTAAAGFKTASLKWTYSGDLKTLKQFKVYSCDADGANLVLVNNVKNYKYTVRNLAQGTHYFVVAAEDIYGNLSAFARVEVYLVNEDNEAPVAVILPKDPMGVEGIAIDFSGVNSTDNDEIASYSWNFGDGTTGTGVNCSHAYSQPGSYTVTLTVTDRSGNKTVAEKEVNVLDVTGADATHSIVTVTVMDGYVEGTPAIANATVTIYDEAGFEITALTDANGKAELVVPNGVCNVAAAASGYTASGRKIVVQGNETGRVDCTVYLAGSSVKTVDGSLTTHVMTYEEIVAAGIDTTDPANNHVVKHAFVLEFKPTPELAFEIPVVNYTNRNGDRVGIENQIIWYEFEVEDDDEDPGDGASPDWEHSVPMKVGVFPITEHFYLVIYGETHWLKEMFNVELLVINNSYAENITDCIAELELPEGLSLASMLVGGQSPVVSLGDIGHVGNTDGLPNQVSTNWYVRGDKEGEYTLTANVTGNFTQDLYNKTPFSTSFTTPAPIQVYAGSALKLFITAQDTAYYNTEYYVQFKLQNVSDRTLYNVSFGLTGAEQYRAEIQHRGKEGDVIKELDKLSEEHFGDAFYTVEEFRPGDAITVNFCTKTLFLSEEWEAFADKLEFINIAYKLQNVFVMTLEGSTTEIPYEVEILPVAKQSFAEWLWDQAKENVGDAIKDGAVDLIDAAFFGGIPVTENVVKVFEYAMDEYEKATNTADSYMTITLERGAYFDDGTSTWSGRSAQEGVRVYTDGKYEIAEDGSIRLYGNGKLYVERTGATVDENDNEIEPQINVTTHYVDGLGVTQEYTYSLVEEDGKSFVPDEDGLRPVVQEVYMEPPVGPGVTYKEENGEPVISVEKPSSDELEVVVTFPFVLLSKTGDLVVDGSNVLWQLIDALGNLNPEGMYLDQNGNLTIDANAKPGDYTVTLSLIQPLEGQRIIPGGAMLMSTGDEDEPVTSVSYTFTLEPAPVVADLTAMEVSFDAEILMWTYFIIPDELLNDDGAKVLVTKNGAWGKTTTEITMAELRAAGPTAYGDYRIEQGIASGEMTREVTVQIMDGDGNDVSIRDYVSGNVDTKVVRTAADYAARVFEVGSAKQKELVKAMLTYGGYSQKHFNVDAGNPVYNLLTEYGYEIPTLEDITAADIAQEMTKSAVSNGVTYSAQEAYLDSAIYHRVYFKLAAGEEISNFRFEIELIDVHGNLYTETVTATYDRVYDEYYVDIEDIAAAHLDHLYTVTVTNLTTGDTYEVTTSVLVWAKTVIARSFNVNQVNLAKAVYYYNQAANVFFGK